MLPIVLKSGSPRRSELLKQIGVEFVVEPSIVEEVINVQESPIEIVQSLAKQKCDQDNYKENHIYLSADTIVVFNNNILGKPKDKQDARRMLQLLSNQTHEVYTGVCLRCNGEEHVFYECTKVFFGPLDIQDIDYYIENYNPLDKAGSYGIQDFGAIFAHKIDGDYFNVMGLPLYRVFQALKFFSNKCLG